MEVQGESGVKHQVVAIDKENKTILHSERRHEVGINDIFRVRIIAVDLEREFAGFRHVLLGASASREAKEYAEDMGIGLALPIRRQ